MATDNKTVAEAKYKVLVVDDEAAQRLLVTEILESQEFDVIEAVNGRDAIACIKEHEFDIVVLDKCMPDISGDEVCCLVRNELEMPFLPLIMVTGTADDEELQKSLQSGASDFVRKPYSSIELLARVRAAANNKRVTDQLDNMESILFALARMVEAKDEVTGDHCSRLEHMSVVFGKELGLDFNELVALRRGGVLHDIGKLGIPDSILLKKGPLTSEEWDVMRQHSALGCYLCNGLKSMKYTVPIIRHHHERWDGGGYPDRLKGEEIPFLARAFQILDIYDALSNERPYKKAFSQDEIIAIFEEDVEKGWRDPALVSVFLNLLRTRPEDLLLPQEKQREQETEIYGNLAGISSFARNRG